MEAQATQHLDVRWLPPPEPFEHIMRALQQLPPDTALMVHIHREPFPLYDVLHDEGYAWQTVALDDGNFDIRITRAT
ncbi:MAG: DUF2249 domain-containing protein [Gammaproteobacteria bacterium]|nr:DUF2249 domain-containing protein [Gammaproteobacteria bacterium]MBU1776944.1 DUF2249 domain-containing protein [Gammaproteobacteria bacterium]MBU1968583.1 DUF2249 domain-containing protein [Gammaproteobacteria bacterium]